jgi:hypothetical protein
VDDPDSALMPNRRFELEETDFIVFDEEERPEFRGSALYRRKVWISKVLGQNTKITLQTAFIGTEERPPRVGKSYRVLTGEKVVFCTSTVVRVAPGYIQTRNSVYRLVHLEENKPPAATRSFP